MCATKICTILICMVICVIHKTNSIDVKMSDEPLFNISSKTFQSHDVREIEKLDLARCSISNVHLNSFENMNKLIDLNLNHNNLQKLPDDTFAQTTNLKELSLHGNKIEVFPKNILANLKSLQRIDLGRNRIRVLHPSTFENNKNLTTLACVSNNITELPQNIFNRLTSLKTLLLFNNSISAIDPTTFDQNKQVMTIDLSGNKLTKIKSGTFINLLRLKYLYLENNEINYIEINAFPVSTALNIIYLNTNKLQYLDPAIIMNLKDITRIVLYDNPWKCNRRIKPLLTTLDKYGDNVPTCAEPAALAGKGWDTLEDKHFSPPVLTISPDVTTHYAEEGDSVLFSCRVTGNVDPTNSNIQWTHEPHILNVKDFNRFDIESNVINGSLLNNLHINNVQKQDGGLYNCIYQGGFKIIEHSISLSVHDVDKNQDLSWDKRTLSFKYESNVYTNLKQSVQLACLLDVQLESNMYWAFNDKIINSASDDRYHIKQSLATNNTKWFNMTIFNVRNEDAGTYTCESSYNSFLINEPIVYKNVTAFHLFIGN